MRELTQHKENDEPAESIQDRIYKHVYSKQVRTLLQARMTRSERGEEGGARRERRTRLPLGPPWSSLPPLSGRRLVVGSFPLFSGPASKGTGNTGMVPPDSMLIGHALSEDSPPGRIPVNVALMG